jgi:hypothetical protein
VHPSESAADRSIFLRYRIKTNRLLQCSKGLILDGEGERDPATFPHFPKGGPVGNNELRTELAPLEERIRRLGGEPSYAFGMAVGDAIVKIGAAVRRVLEAQKPAPSIGGGHPAGAGD